MIERQAKGNMELALPTERDLRRPGETARRIVEGVLAEAGWDGQEEKVTLYELCCGRNSKLSTAVAKLGSAAMRLTKPRQWRQKRRR